MFKAFIFDFDGVIVDSGQYWLPSQQELYKRLMPSWTEEDMKGMQGLSTFDEHTHLSKNFGLNMSYEEYGDELEKLAIGIYGERATLIDGIPGLLQRLKERNIPIAIATSSNLNWTEISLKRFGLSDYFPLITTGQEVEGRGKPHPDIYLLTAKKLGVDPTYCVVLEDSRGGIQAGKAAGMYVIGFAAPDNPQDASGADMSIAAMEELTSESIDAMFA